MIEVSRYSAYRAMWILVFFDLPTETKKDKKAASNGKEKKPKAHKKKEEEEDEEKIKRPSNPYIFFQNEQREILKKEKPDMAFKEIAAEIGNK